MKKFLINTASTRILLPICALAALHLAVYTNRTGFINFLFIITPCGMIWKRHEATKFEHDVLCCFTYINVVGINKVRALIFTKHIKNNACVVICKKTVFSQC